MSDCFSLFKGKENHDEIVALIVLMIVTYAHDVLGYHIKKGRAQDITYTLACSLVYPIWFLYPNCAASKTKLKCVQNRSIPKPTYNVNK